MHAVSAVLEVSTNEAIRRGEDGCCLHRRLVEEMAAKDTIISFNYDCVVDHALRKHGDGKWSARYGYALPRPRRIEGVDRWKPASSSRDTIYLLKLHGSLNWQLPHGATSPDTGHRLPIKLKERLHGQRGVPKFTIIPPVWNKAAADHPTFKVLWKNAERAIRSAEQLAVVSRKSGAVVALAFASPVKGDRRRQTPPRPMIALMIRPSVGRLSCAPCEAASRAGDKLVCAVVRHGRHRPRRRASA